MKIKLSTTTAVPGSKLEQGAKRQRGSGAGGIRSGWVWNHIIFGYLFSMLAFGFLMWHIPRTFSII